MDFLTLDRIIAISVCVSVPILEGVHQFRDHVERTDSLTAGILMILSDCSVVNNVGILHARILLLATLEIPFVLA